ncbi:phospholipid carrier-dependent glycosyltransferase [Paenibacillus zeisoli]|uniref:Phospholipid carrier-dependent glycosyltransferase n=1 Tax=Paenibacillus zeisoli TaxID=2496267 RepID=A0A3S1B4E0_9BACL|nr:glycosyltransferase family 39 protein [Paenibacillus zeisoli]RUT29573.1 phospholipid carrier-dependent glycosyltransferase [Paenibacillus zeisoli]
MKLLKKMCTDKLLILIVLLAAFLNLYGIWNDQYANTYYTTAVASMLQNFHNFFYGSLDSAGSVTVDKPPVTFWIQTISAYIFGLHGWSVILPQALAGIGSVLLIYFLVRPTFGLASARIAALVMACMPVAVAVSRTNNIDSMLVFTLLLAAWLLFRGIRRNRIWNLLGAFAMVGVGFNMKMLQAYMVLPAFYLFYLLAVKASWKRKVSILAGCTAVLMVVSLSWAVTVDSISKDKRPYIGSSETNSVLELAFGYNGVSRLTGNQGGMGAGTPPGGSFNGENPGQTGMGNAGGGGSSGMNQSGSAQASNGPSNGTQLNSDPSNNAPSNSGAQSRSGQTNSTQANNNQSNTALSANNQAPQAGMNQDDGGRGWNGQGMPPFGENGRNDGSRGMGSMFGTGTPGPLRLFQTELSGQASWLLPFVLFGLVALFAGIRRNSITEKHKEALFWLAWLGPVMVFFSIAGFFHHYYLIMLAAPIAALVGAGWTAMWTSYRERSGWKSWLLPAAVIVTAAFQYYIVQAYNSTIGTGWSIAIATAGIVAAGVLVYIRRQEKSWKHTAAVAGFLVLMIGPVFWAWTPLTYGLNSMIPQAGPGTSSGMRGMGFPGGANGPFGDMTPPGMNSGSGSTGIPAGGDSANNTTPSDTSPGSAAQNDSRSNAGQGGRGMGESQKVNTKLLAYLKKNNTGQEYLFATTNYGTAAPYMIDEDESVIIMGGFSGSDPVYTTAKLETLVKSSKVKYFLVGGGMGGRGGSSELTTWIKDHGTEIPSSEWNESGSTAEQTDSGLMQGGPDGNMTLYEVTVK